jgi:pyruvate/2-oxoglutarate/acetoin dehydrogenase E1 component
MRSVRTATQHNVPIIIIMKCVLILYATVALSCAHTSTAHRHYCLLCVNTTTTSAGGTSPNQALGAEHSQPLHAYVMGIPGLKICTAASPAGAYGLAKSMIRDNGKQQHNTVHSSGVSRYIQGVYRSLL